MKNASTRLLAILLCLSTASTLFAQVLQDDQVIVVNQDAIRDAATATSPINTWVPSSFNKSPFAIQPLSSPVVQPNLLDLNKIGGGNIWALDYNFTPTINYKLDFNSESTRYFKTTDLYGCPISDDAFNIKIVADAVDWNRCFEGSVIASDSIDANNTSALKQDLNVCKCLRDHPDASLSTIMGLQLNRNDVIAANLSQDVAQERIASSQPQMQAALDQATNGMAFQAAIIAGDSPAADKFVAAYSKSPFNYDENQNQNAILFKENGEFSLNLKPAVFDGLNHDKIPYGSYVDEKGNKREICYSMREFHLKRAFPNQQEAEVLGPQLMKRFDDDDWDYNQLQGKYEKIMRNSLSDRKEKREEILKLKTKLRFLNRNPMLKYFLGASDSDRSEAIALRPDVDFNLKDKKRELFDKIKTSMSGEGCFGANMTKCMGEVQNKLLEFFSDPVTSPVVASVVRSQMRKDIVAKSQAVDKASRASAPMSQLNQSALMSQFRAKYQIERPVTCAVNPNVPNADNNSSRCLKKMSAYCRYIEQYTEAIVNAPIEEEDTADIADTLADELKNDFITDPEKNTDFQKVNEYACHTKYPNKTNPQEEKTFFEFMGEYCSKNETAPECKDVKTTEDWYKLRQLYRNAFEVEKTQQQAQRGSTDPVRVVITPDLDPKLVEGAAPESGGSSGAASGGNGGDSDGDEGFADASCAPFCVTRKSGSNKKSYSDDEYVITKTRAPASFEGGSGVETDSKQTKTTPTQTSGSETGPVAASFSGSGYSGYGDGQVARQDPMTQISQQNLANRAVQEQIVSDLEEKVEDITRENPSSPELVKLREDLAAVRAAFAQSQMTNTSLVKKLSELEKAQDILSRYNMAPRSEAAPSSGSSGRTRDQRRGSGAVVSGTSGAGGPSKVAGGEGETRPTGQAQVQVPSFGGSTGARRQVSSDASSDAIKREESKLVNIDQGNNGSLVVSTVPRSGGSQANGIAVEVPMTIYQNIQSNPEGIDLSQITLPREQLEQVKDRPFTLLVSSPSGDSSIRVQVQIKNNRVVRVDENNDGKADQQVQTVSLNQLNLVFRPFVGSTR